jgi:AraC-like DNA-binding protein
VARHTVVAALARSVGYTNESSFSNAFKRVMGVSPRGYRDAARDSDDYDLIMHPSR